MSFFYNKDNVPWVSFSLCTFLCFRSKQNIRVPGMFPQIPVVWACLHILSMWLCSLSKAHTKHATASLLNCMRSWRCKASSSSLLCSNVARKPFAFSLRGRGGGVSCGHPKRKLIKRFRKLASLLCNDINI